MRKVILFALTICMMFMLAVSALADCREPAFTEFEVVCTKDTPYFRENWEKGGAMEKIGSFPAGTTLKVVYEFEEDGVLYGNVEIGYGEDAEWMHVRLSDVTLKDKTYLPKNEEKLSRSHSVRVIEKSGVPMYAGPNKKYDKIMTIPYGTKLTYTYGNDEESFYRAWAYVTCLNKSGWIYVYSGDTKNGLAELPEAGEKAEIWVLEDDVKLYDGISFGNIEENFKEWDQDELEELHEEPARILGTLEKGKKYTYRYSHGGGYGYTWYFVTAGLRSGWVYQAYDVGGIAVSTSLDSQNSYLTYKPLKLKLHEIPNAKSDATTVSVDKNTILNPEFVAYTNDNTYYYETIQGKSGWYSVDDADDACAYKLEEYEISRGYTNKNENEQAAPIYADICQKGKAIGRIPSNSLFTPLYYGSNKTVIDEDNSEYTWFYYVRYNNLTGWVVESDLFSQEEVTNEPEEIDDYDDWATDEEWGNGSLDQEEQEVYYENDDEYEFDETYVDEQHALSPRQIVLICVVGAIVLALTATVTLLLIYRKRNGDKNMGNEIAMSVEEMQETNDTKSDIDEGSGAE